MAVISLNNITKVYTVGPEEIRALNGVDLQVEKNADDLVVPAREGTLRVLRAANDAGARRVVLTSSFAAIASLNFLMRSGLV